MLHGIFLPQVALRKLLLLTMSLETGRQSGSDGTVAHMMLGVTTVAGSKTGI